MKLIDDFFILIWGEKFDYQSKNIHQNNEEFLQACSVVLCLNSKNYKKFLKLSSFQDICLSLDDKKCLCKNDAKALQYSILSCIKHFHLDDIKNNIQRLCNEKIISYNEEQKLISLLELIIQEEEIEKPKKQSDGFCNILENFIHELKKTSPNKICNNKLNALHFRMKNQTFSIGVTGVMNAGKSTLLNALLRKEILGTSNIPETANLSILKHGNKNLAKVSFWSKDELAEIEKSASFLPQIQGFMEDIRKNFSSRLDEFICQNSKTIEIPSNKLATYTSAKSPLCSLVKSVEIYEELDFLKNGVQIVDTPGLDDPVVQREEITKHYLNDCDVLIHLMNVTQSATKKDIDFIIHSLSYGHITRLLIVLTRIDTIDKNELKEVENYTKQSIKNRLAEQNNEAKFNSIIKKIEFLPVAGKFALMHRTGKEKEAVDGGYNLEQTGILDIERYLRKILFGKDNQKTKLFNKSIYTQLNDIVTNQEQILNFELENLNKDGSYLERELKLTKEKNELNLKNIHLLQEQILIAKENLQTYLLTLDNLLKTKLLALASVLTKRVYDDVSYGFKKENKKPPMSRIGTIIETTIKDNIVDIIRDYRYEFEKRMKTQMEMIKSDEIIQSNFNSKEFFDANFKGSFLSKSYDLTKSKVSIALKKVKKNKLNDFNIELNKIFSTTTQDLSKSIFASLDGVNKVLLDGFLELSNKPLDDLKNNMKAKEEVLLEHISLLKIDEKKADEKRKATKQKLDSLLAIKQKLMELKNEFI